MDKHTNDAIEDLLTRGVANIISGKTALEKLLKSGKKLNIYLGIDPTATRIHLGHAVPLRKLQAFADLGHNVTFLIGDFTALIGDTSDKDTERPVLTYEQIENNFATYKQQAEKILDFSKVTVRHNREWLSQLGFADVIKLARHFSLNDFISRELIKKRLTNETSVSLPEVLYPIMQGYDSYFLDTDIQLGGTDQTFNMQAGRTLQKSLRGKDSFVLAGEFLEGTDGRKMSKSWNNAIWIEDTPNEMYGKVMSINDNVLLNYFRLGTRLPLNHVQEVERRIKAKENPLNLKKELAHVIVTEFHSSEAADLAQKFFEKTIQSHELPEDITTMKVISDNIIDILVETKLAPSKSEAKRLITQGGVKVNGEKVGSIEDKVSIGNATVSVGSRKFIKLE
jgi:tyrosyl-tRNA synthetase